jgi:hypothetical protein
MSSVCLSVCWESGSDRAVTTYHDKARRSGPQPTSMSKICALPDRGRGCVELRKSLQLEDEGSLREKIRGKKDTAIVLAALGAALDYASSKRVSSCGLPSFRALCRVLTILLFFSFELLSNVHEVTSRLQVLRRFYFYHTPGVMASAGRRTHYEPPWGNASIIGVAGSSGSGKTSLAMAIVASLNLPWVVILSMVGLLYSHVGHVPVG